MDTETEVVDPWNHIISVGINRRVHGYENISFRLLEASSLLLGSTGVSMDMEIEVVDSWKSGHCC
jgi:hypothetical protein